MPKVMRRNQDLILIYWGCQMGAFPALDLHDPASTSRAVFLALTHDCGAAPSLGRTGVLATNQEAEIGSLGHFFLSRKLQRWLTR